MYFTIFSRILRYRGTSTFDEICRKKRNSRWSLYDGIGRVMVEEIFPDIVEGIVQLAFSP